MSDLHTKGGPPPAGVIRSWGFNGWGQLGIGSADDSGSPALAPGLQGVITAAAGADHTLAVTADGAVWTWGFNGAGQLGDGSASPRAVPGRVSGELPLIGAATAGYAHSLGLDRTGAVWAWGSNVWGQLGDGTFANRHEPVRVMLAPGNHLNGVMALAGGRGHSLALCLDGTVLAWGYNGQKQLGHPNVAAHVSPEPVVVTEAPGRPLDRVAAVAAGASHSLALRSDGTVWEWGFSPANTLGPTDPQPIPGLDRVVAVAGGENHSLALDTDGAVWAWGVSWWGQMGNGGTAPVWAPTRIPGLAGIERIAAGFNHCLAIGRDGTVWAWGSNTHGAVGAGLPFSVKEPVQVPGVGGAVLAAGGGDHSLVVI